MRTAVRFSSIAALLVFLCSTGVSQERSQLQTPRSEPEPPAILKVTTRLVTVDVVARDRHGNPVRDLTAKDFQISEQSGSHKSQQQIASFRLLDRSLKNASDSESAALQLPAGVFTNMTSTKSLSAPPTILLVDGLNTDATTQLQVRQQMVRLLASVPSDVPMAVFLLGRKLRLLQSFTTDTKLLRAAAQRALSLEATNLQAKDARDDTLSHSSLLEQMAGAEGQSDVPGGAPRPGSNSNAMLAMRALELQRFEREQYAESMDMRVKLTFDALRLIARHVSGYPGRKNLIWLSSAFPLAITPDANLTMVAKFSGMRNYGAEMSAVASALTDAQIAVYPVDPRGMQTQALFDAQSRGKANPFSEGATLNRESSVRFLTQDSMENLAQQTGGKVCMNNNDLSECVKRAIDDSSSYYELSYYPTDKNWHGEFRRTSVKTSRSGVQLSFREGYFARETDATTWAKDAKATDAHLSQAACNDFLTATSIFVEASALPPDQSGQTKYLLVIDPNAVSFRAADGEQNVQIELATCMFNARGLPLQYNRQSLGQKFTETEYQTVKAHGISHTISFVPKPDTARIRLLVCDTRTGMIGSLDLPYPTQIISIFSAKPENGAKEAANAAGKTSLPSQASSHIIKFHGNEGRDGTLEWNAERISYSGDMQVEASAKALFDSLWAKSYACESGRLLSVHDKTTPAPQPLHFRADDGHGAEVYLDGQEGVRYSGNVAADPSAKPFFEALRSLYQCKNPAATSPPK
ncbi:MAG TPA: VWA domain-containing protein [Candidatus Acidoferrum sp.]|nr:VWA domain-containing protein [Candidatus Acidoferrum sp.]